VLRFLSIFLTATFLSAAPAGTAFAVQPDEVLSDPALEQRARDLSRDLRCMVCQNQSIDDSDAPLARDLRVLVRERLKAGDSNERVLDFLVSRYGEFVLLKPRFALHNAILWAAPVLVLLIGLIVVLLNARRRVASPPPPLAEGEEKRLHDLVR
jgi:cytochrome c-type biogenesis protein CcmH